MAINLNLLPGSSTKLALSAYAALVGATPGSTALAEHKAYIAGNSATTYVAALDGLFANTSNAVLATSMLANLGLSSLFTQAEGEAYLAANSGNRVQAILNLSDMLLAYNGTDAAVLAAQTAYADDIDYSFQYSSVSANTSTEALPSAPTTGDNFRLTTGLDILTGTAFADAFTANVIQNSLGQQVNTLGSGDELHGGAGMDTLTAKLTSGAFVNGLYSSESMPIQAETTSIEVVKIEAVESAIGFDGFNNDFSNTQVYVNAKDMTDVAQLWSSRSDADLIIQNLTTVGLSQLSDMTIGMEYTGNSDTRWGASDMTVYFDQDYLTPEATRTNPSVEFLAMNEDNYDVSGGTRPLEGVFFRELKFTLNGARFDLRPYLGENPDGAGNEIITYADFLAAVQEALIELKADNVGNAALQTIEANFGSNFTTDANPDTLELRVGTAVRLSVDGLTDGVSNVISVASTDLEVARAAAATVPNNNRYELADPNPAVSGEVLAINVALEKVGLAGDGGELIIGSMNKHEGNLWDAVNTVTDTTSGIEQFNVTVYGANDKSSSLAGLHSTNNNLRVVNVVTDAALTGTSFADLTIGNSNTDMGVFDYADALKDVQTFNAAGFKGDLTVFAALTSEVTDKYLDLQDEADAAVGADNVAFAYTGGTGDDDFNIALSAVNLAAAGTATREDMTVNVAGGNGDDMITLAIVGNGQNSAPDLQDFDTLAYASFGPFSTEDSLANWYDNQKLNANLSIDGGAGDDTIWTPGSGDIIIDAGTGNDTVYADNTGDTAVWAFNVAPGADAVRLQLNNLQSDTNQGYQLYKATLTVNFLGFNASAALPSNRGVATDAEINQALKLAINNDAELSKLLVATDGPGNTLVVTSLIDGAMVADDLVVGITAPTSLSAGDVQQLATWYNLPGSTSGSLLALFTSEIADFVAEDDYATDSFAMAGDDLVGSNSLHTSDNTITGDLGNDVLVLGTGRLSNDTVVYAGFGNGTDSIVNFVGADSETTTHNTAVVNITQQGAAATAGSAGSAEVITLALTGTAAAAAPGAIAFAAATFGAAVSYTPAVGEAAAVVATNIIAAFNLAATTWTASAGPAGTVVLTNDVVGNVTDATISNSLATAITYDGSGIGMTAAITDGVAAVAATVAVAEVFTVTFGDSTQAATYSFGGDSVAVLNGETGANIAAAFASADATGWNEAHVADTNVVTYTSTTPGVIADEANASFVGANIAVTTFGFTSASDIIDFSAYDAVAVVVDGVLIRGTAATAGQEYVLMTESNTNDGSYTTQVYTEAGATDTLVGLVGVLDFGVEQTFVEANFII